MLSFILHVVVYIPIAMAAGAYAYRYRTQLVEAKDKVAARLKTLR